MLMLLEEPLNLIQGDLITVRVRATNSKGWGDFSEQNTQGKRVEKKPAAPAIAPVMLEQAETQIRLHMPMVYGDDTGNSPILSYNLQFNLGGNSEQYISVVGEAPDSLV
jgi:hypothetical protein